MFIKDGKRFNVNASHTFGGTQFPPGHFRDAYARGAYGITEIPEPLREDTEFYYVQELDVAPYVINTPRDFEQCKARMVEKVKSAAKAVLSESDWRVVRASETGTELDPEFLAERAAVRDASDAKEALINACASIQELQALTL